MSHFSFFALDINSEILAGGRSPSESVKVTATGSTQENSQNMANSSKNMKPTLNTVILCVKGLVSSQLHNFPVKKKNNVKKIPYNYLYYIIRKIVFQFLRLECISPMIILSK